jgi:hypothetical protein
MTTTRYKIAVLTIGRRTGAWSDHIVIEAAADVPRAATLNDNVNVHRWSASLLSRLATLVHKDLRQQTSTCGCPNVCSLVVRDPIVTFEALDAGDWPSLDVTVNRNAEKHWLRLLKSRINEINKADRWQPTDADEGRWIRSATEHLEAPDFTPSEVHAR